MIVLLFLAFNVLLFLLALLWILVPAFYGLPSKPTDPDRIRKALQAAGLKPGETLFDLGAGDGRVLIIAAKEFGANAVGIEIGPVQCLWAWLKIMANGLDARAKIRWGNMYKTALTGADVVFFYGTSKEVRKLEAHLEKQMKPGSRVISISADFPEWEPSILDEPDLFFVYHMPPVKGNMTTYMLKKLP